jgi:gas vesicle protein
MVDIVAHRKELTSTIGAILGMLMAPQRGKRAKVVEEATAK